MCIEYIDKVINPQSMKEEIISADKNWILQRTCKKCCGNSQNAGQNFQMPCKRSEVYFEPCQTSIF